VRICVVTGTRAEYGLLRPVMRALEEETGFELQVVVTGSHLSPEFGMTVTGVEQDGFVVHDRVEMLLSADTPSGITKSMGLATIGFADTLRRLEPDLLLVLGDRYEILAVVQAALVARVPVVHLSGGDVTEGAIDDAIRHAITKMSHLHLVTNEDAARRVRQMGEDPQRVIVAGNTGLDDLLRFEPLEVQELEAALGLRLRPRNVLVTYHPVTLADEPPAVAGGELVAALEELGDEVGVVITLPNADTAGRVLIDLFRDLAGRRDNVVAHESLGQERYWSCLRTFDAVVGNSSSGLIEAPAAGRPAVDIGARQQGRLRSASTIHCSPRRAEIRAAIDRALDSGGMSVESPYGDGHATERVLEALRGLDDPRTLLEKRFHAW
jgi:UDP-hydrolysing UDP-N-acetyl-D-glucosamine 2-epimerase